MSRSPGACAGGAGERAPADGGGDRGGAGPAHVLRRSRHHQQPRRAGVAARHAGAFGSHCWLQCSCERGNFKPAWRCSPSDTILPHHICKADSNTDRILSFPNIVQVLVDALRKTKSGVGGRSRKRQRTARRGGEPWTSGDNDDSDTQSGDSSYEYGARRFCCRTIHICCATTTFSAHRALYLHCGPCVCLRGGVLLGVRQLSERCELSPEPLSRLGRQTAH